MAAEYYARLGIFSKTLTPDKINAILGLNYEKGYEKGDIIRPHGIVQRKEHQWFIYSQISRRNPIEDHIDNILQHVSKVAEKIKALSSQPGTDVELACIIYSKESPALNFSEDVIERLHEMGASLDIDLYYWDKPSKS